MEPSPGFAASDYFVCFDQADLDEVRRNLRANRPDLDTATERTRRLMNDAIRCVTVSGDEKLVGHLIWLSLIALTR